MKSVRVVWSLLLAALVLTTGTPSTYAWSSAQATVSVFGGTSADRGNSIAVDSSGNVYTTGFFQDTVDFDPGAGTSNLTSAGSGDVFVSKLDSSGALVWAKRLGGTSLDIGYSIAVDSSGNVYTTGYFAGTVDFDPGEGTSTFISSVGDADVFVSKLNSSGNFVWAKSFGGAGSDYGYSIAVDSSGNVYTTGYFALTADFDPGAGTSNLTSAGNNDAFVSKLNSSGNFVWAKSFGGAESEYGFSIAVDSSGNVYTTGYFAGTADFDPGAGTSNLTLEGVIDVFVSKLDSSGALVWAKRLGGTVGDYGYSIAVDSSGNVYTTGYFAGTADFDPGAGTSNLTSAGSGDAFVSKLNSSGNFVWAKSFGGAESDYGYSIAVDSSGNVYTTGYFAGTADFDPGEGTSNLTSAGSGGDIFVSKLDSSGALVWAKRLGGTSADRGNSIAVDSSGNVYTTGYFAGTADFDPGEATSNFTSAGSNDVFVLKLTSSGEALTVAAPAFTLSASSESRTVNTTATGFTINSTGGAIASFSINATPPGMSFNTSTGALTGTPNTVASATDYTITATNASGSATQTFSLTVTAAPVSADNSVAQAAPVAVAPTPVPYLRTLTTPKLNLKDGKLICTPGTYNAGYTLNGVTQGSTTTLFTPSSFTFNFLVNGITQTSLTVTTALSNASWNLPTTPSGALISCSVTVSANGVTNSDKSTDNTSAVSSALSTQALAISEANTDYSISQTAISKAYQKALVDNRAKWRSDTEKIRTDYYAERDRIKSLPSTKTTRAQAFAALKTYIAALKKSAADYRASKPAAAAARDAANKAALDAKSTAIAKANATYGTFIESIGYGVLIL